MIDKNIRNKGIIGIDIGTTSTKAILYSQEFEVLAYANQGYPLYQDIPGMAELDPDEILQVVIEVLAKVVAEAMKEGIEITGISFSSAMHSLIVMDKENQAITRCLTWMDNRGAKASDYIADNWEGLALYHRTGTPIHSMTPFSKILYLKTAKPEIFKKATKFIGIKEYLFYQLFAEYKVDYSIASATGLFNMKTRNWDQQILDLLEITSDQLAEIVSPEYSFTNIAPKYRKKIGLKEQQISFVIGSSDGCLANLGLDAMDNQTAAISIGTSGAVRMVTDQPKTDSLGRTFCYAFSETQWLIGGATNNGGVIFQWLRQLFGGVNAKLDYETMLALAAEVPAGSSGLIFLPYLAGERAPLWDANAQGTLNGIGLQHTQKHFIRGTIEGIYYNINVILQLLAELNGKPTMIKASGGFLQSELSREILADITQQTIFIPENYESSCLGAAILGVTALKQAEFNLQKVKKIAIGHQQEPNTGHQEVYQQSFERYQELVSVMKKNK